MKLIHKDKEITLIECQTFISRFKGFMLTNKIDKALLFNKCNSIHTFFMKKNISVILCNKDNIILYYYPNLSPNKIILPKKNVSKIFELPPYYFDIKLNDRLEIK